jgi:hypothetical protein
VGEAVGGSVGEAGIAVAVGVVAEATVDVGCAVEVCVAVGGAEVAVKAAAVAVGGAAAGVFVGSFDDGGLVAGIGKVGSGVGERVGTVWRAGSWFGVAQATPESETTSTMLETNRAASHCPVRRRSSR